ncbi:tyrosine-protein phosphatase [Saccharomonospora piscinae]|uniref:tyrosine-protein phosphatase n=1 Tax=Saccharomonospora piscinae TaxID=687388 RepID=UPI0004642270|nr:tyrosine-protein phosphatase [Saccharomonospora piscinae]
MTGDRELEWQGCVNARDLGGLGRADADPGCVVFHCACGKDRTGLLALVLRVLAEADPEEIVADYLLSYDRMKQRYDELGVRDQLAAVRDVVASRDTTIEDSLTSTIASLRMPDFLLENGLSEAELADLRARLTTGFALTAR